METDTIAAIATPIGSSGIGIVRVSGPAAIDISRELFHPHNTQHNLSKTRLHSHHLYYGTIRDSETGGVVDEVLLACMVSPHSYTREDVVEIQSHSGAVILRKILTLVIDHGARLAEAGEFTKRAFLNGRIDLTQAESIAEMISAKTEVGLQLAASHLTGGFKNEIDRILDSVTEIQVALEANVEFPEEVEDHVDYHRIAHTLKEQAIDRIVSLLDQYEDGHILRDGVRVDIVGRPNVGKSSLLNRLLKKDKAIVTHIPGTTRDLIEDHISIDGIPIIVTDTAGLHTTEDPVEIIGIRKTRENLQLADIVLLVIDGDAGFVEEDHKAFVMVDSPNKIIVVNKSDLFDDGQRVAVPKAYGGHTRVEISAKHGHGIQNLKSAIKDKCINEVNMDPGRSIVPNFRQKRALEDALNSLELVMDGLEGAQTEELILSDLDAAKNALGLITGEGISGDLLDQIFNKFCIGK